MIDRETNANRKIGENKAVSETYRETGGYRDIF